MKYCHFIFKYIIGLHTIGSRRAITAIDYSKIIQLNDYNIHFFKKFQWTLTPRQC